MAEDFICYARGRLLGLILAGYVPLASQNPYPITVCSVAKDPILVTFGKIYFRDSDLVTFCLRIYLFSKLS